MSWKEVFDAKFKYFSGGFIGGAVSGGIYLFGGAFPAIGFWHMFYVGVIKLIATFSFALAGGVGTALAAPAIKWMGKKIKRIFRKKKRRPPNYGESFGNNGFNNNKNRA